MAVKTEKLQLTADQYLAILMYIVVKARIKDLEAQMFLIEQFTNDFTLNVTREGYMFLTVKQAIEFLKNVDEGMVAQEGYLLSLIEQKRADLAQKRNVADFRQQTMLIGGHLSSGQRDMSFNILSNPNVTDQSLVFVSRLSSDF